MKKHIIVIIFILCMITTASSINFGTKRSLSAVKNSVQGFVDCGTLNVRKGPWLNIIGKIHKGDSVNIIGQSADRKWYRIDYNGKTAYVYKGYINTSPGTQNQSSNTTSNNTTPTSSTYKFPFDGVTTAGTLNVRDNAWGRIIDKFSRNTKVTVCDKQGAWYRIKHRTGYAWVHSDYVVLAGSNTAIQTQPTASATTVPGASGKAAVAVNAAMAQLGVPYKYGKSSPGVAFDCSGLTTYVWKQAGISIPHQSRLQYNSIPHVSQANAKPGDLVFFHNPISHVGMYLGNNKYIHAPRTGDVVKIATLNWSKVVGIGRPGG